MRIPLIHGVIDRRILVNFRVAPEGPCARPACALPPKAGRRTWDCGDMSNPPPKPSAEVSAPVYGVLLGERGTPHCGSTGTMMEGPVKASTSHEETRPRASILWLGVAFFLAFTTMPASKCLRVRIGIRWAWIATTVRPVSSSLGTNLIASPHPRYFTPCRKPQIFLSAGRWVIPPPLNPGAFDGLELRSYSWGVSPLAVERVESNFFSDQIWFPPGSVEFDCALLMRDIEHEWQAQDDLYCSIA